MSLAINTDMVTDVLLADGWHKVARGSFDLDSYEFMEGDVLVHGGGQSGVCAKGATWREAGRSTVISCPLTAVLAVRHR